MRKVLYAIALAIPVALVAQAPADSISPRAKRLHDRAIVVDSHADTTQRLIFDTAFDIGKRNPNGNIDIPRMREGGLDALFFSIWVPSDVTGPTAVKRALDQIDAVREAVRTHPHDLMLATTAADVRKAAADHKIAALMGMEGGHMIDDDLRLLRVYAALGVRYMTLTHYKNNNWADSSTDAGGHNGLTAFGKDVIREMNRLGVMVDISHVADKTFFDAIETTRAPVIASHSSSRAIANHARNMTDDMMRALARNGGVVMINYHAAFLSEEFRVASEKKKGTAVGATDAVSKKCGGNEACATMEGERIDHEAMMKGDLPKVTWEKIVEHIDHAVKTAGVDHVGLGSDFDGATMPLGMEDASKLPKITDALLKKGYSEADVEKILGGNILRVMEAVERLKGVTQYPQEFAMRKTAITAPELTPPVGPFSQAIEVSGFLYFSGQVGQDPATGKVVEGGIVAETQRVFENLAAVLKAAGRSFDDVARAGVYLTKMSDFGAMNGIYAKYFSQPFPARTTIGVAALPLGACVEIDLVVRA